MPEFRRDPFSGRTVLIAAERAGRPNEFAAEQALACPFCEGREAETPPEVAALRPRGSPPDGPGWTVRVVPNKYPALVDGRLSPGQSETWPAAGAHEVVIESPRHLVSAREFSPGEFAEVLKMVAMRLRELRRRPGLCCASMFRNEGRHGGASLSHVHSQIMALPLAPPGFEREWNRAREYFARRKRCCFCDWIKGEVRDGTRLVRATDGCFAIAPFAPRFAYETWILPAHQARFEELARPRQKSLRIKLARLLLDLWGAMEGALGGVSTNLMLYDAPFEKGAEQYWHWRLALIPRIAQVAGFEFATEMHVSVIDPESAAARLRDGLQSGLRSRRFLLG